MHLFSQIIIIVLNLKWNFGKEVRGILQSHVCKQNKNFTSAAIIWTSKKKIFFLSYSINIFIIIIIKDKSRSKKWKYFLKYINAAKNIWKITYPRAYGEFNELKCKFKSL